MGNVISYSKPTPIINLSEYCANRLVRQNAGYSNGRYLHEGKWFDKEDFESLFPV